MSQSVWHHILHCTSFCRAPTGSLISEKCYCLIFKFFCLSFFLLLKRLKHIKSNSTRKMFLLFCLRDKENITFLFIILRNPCFKILPVFSSFILYFSLPSAGPFSTLQPSFLPSSPLKQNVVNYLFIFLLNKNVLIVLASLSCSLQSTLWATAFHTFHFTSCPHLVFSFSFSVHLHSLPHCMLLVSSFLFQLLSSSFFFSTSPSLPPPVHPSFSNSPTHLPIISLAASGHIHSIKAQVLLLLLPLIMRGPTSSLLPGCQRHDHQ